MFVRVNVLLPSRHKLENQICKLPKVGCVWQGGLLQQGYLLLVMNSEKQGIKPPLKMQTVVLSAMLVNHMGFFITCFLVTTVSG